MNEGVSSVGRKMGKTGGKETEREQGKGELEHKALSGDGADRSSRDHTEYHGVFSDIPL